MKTLIVEDDFSSRILLQRVMSEFGQVDVAHNGQDAVSAFRTALQNHSPYDLIFMDVLMPEMDGQQALLEIREIEKGNKMISNGGTKVIMTSAMGDPENVIKAYHKGGVDSYLVKPIDLYLLFQQLQYMEILR